MNNDYTYITGQSGDLYEIFPTDGLVSFLQRLAEREERENEAYDSAIQPQAEFAHAQYAGD